MSQKLEGAAKPAPRIRSGMAGRRAIGASLALLLLIALPVGSNAARPPAGRGLGLNYDLAKARKAMSDAVKAVGAPPKALNDYFNLVPYSMAHLPAEQAIRSQPNGDSFAVRVTDISKGAAQVTMDGYLVTQGRDGWWRYARWGTDQRFVATKAIVGRDRAPEVARESNRPAALKKALADYNLKREQMREYMSLRSRSVAAAAAAAGQPVVIKVPVIMFKVNNQDFLPESTPEKFKNLFSGVGTNPHGTVTELYLEQSFGNMVVQFDVFGPYDISISNNDLNDCWYGTDGGPILGAPIIPENPTGIEALDNLVESTGLAGFGLGLGGYGAKGMALESVLQADPEVDFSQYDNDGDNYVDFLMTVHSGPGAEATGDPCNVHSHYFAGLGPAVTPIATELTGVDAGASLPSEPTPPTLDGVMVGAAMTVPEIDLEIGVVAHEYMHALGEPDYYGTQSTEGTGEWDLGAAGPWLGVPAQSNPIHFNPVMKINFGWVKPRMVDGTTRDVSVRPREKYSDLVMIPTRIEGADSPEAEQCDRTPISGKPHQNIAFRQADGSCLAEGFLIEQLSRSGAQTNFNACTYQSADFDRQAYASGLLIWYWDFTNYESLGNDNAARPMLDVKEFDRRDDTQELGLGISRAEPLDLFWGDPVGISGATPLSAKAVGLAPPAGSPYTVTAPAPGTSANTPEWTAPLTKFNVPMIVTLDWQTSEIDDWDLTVERKVGTKWVEAAADGAPPATGPEQVSFVFEPGGIYRANAANFASVSPQATVTVSYDIGAIPLFGAAGTLNSEFQQTGWQITNIRPNGYRGLAHAIERSGRAIVFDIVKHTNATTDVSGDFLKPAAERAEPILAGKQTLLTTKLYNHGGKPVKATLSFFDRDPATGAAPLATVSHSLGAYQRKPLSFNYTPKLGLNELWVKTTAPGDLVPGNDVVRSELVAYQSGPADLLLVDNDRGWSQEEAIEAVLQSLGVRYHLVVGEPSLATLKKYKSVIWTTTTVSGYKGVISAEAIAALKQYLSGGGKLWAQSTRLMSYLAGLHGEAEFLAGYFGLVAENNLLGSMGKAVRVGSSSAELASLDMGYLDGRPYLDYGVMASEGVKGKATALYKHSLRSDGVIATKVEGTGFRTVYSPPLGVLTAAKDQLAFAKEALAFLGVPTDKASAAAATIKFNRFGYVQVGQGWTVQVGAVAPEGVRSVELIYRPAGAVAWTSATLKAVGDGIYEGSIPKQNVRNNGLEYFAQLTTTTGQVVQSGGGPQLPNLAAGPYGTPAAIKYGKCAAKVAGVKVTNPTVGGGLPATGVGRGVTAGLIALGAALGAGLWLRRKRHA